MRQLSAPIAALTRLPRWLLPLLLALLLVAVPWLQVDPYWTRQIVLISILALIVSGLNLSWGYAGELALGHVAMYAAGAYVGGILTLRGVDLALALPAAAASAAVIGLVSGAAGIRLGGWGLAMVSFFLVLLVPDTVEIFSGTTGGFAGLSGLPAPQLFGAELNSGDYYLLVVLCLIAWLAFLRNLVTSRHGGALRVLRQSHLLASSLGINVTRTKLVAYLLGAIPAGVAGCLFALLDGFIAPEYFGLDLMIAIIAASVLGGSESVYGAVLGAALLQLGPMRATQFDRYALVGYGVFLVVGGVLLSGGIAGLANRWLRGLAAGRRSLPDTPRNAGEIGAMAPIPGEQLEIRGVTKQFGGARALDGVDLVVRKGAVTGLIGANGSGKTTLLNIVSGFYTPTEGTVAIGGHEVQGRSPHRLANRGVARTFQTPLIPRSMTTAEVVASARYARHRSGVLPAVLRLPGFRRLSRSDREAALGALRVLGIEQLADQPASALPLGSRRLVEVARALAAEPAVLLLDEPASGLSTEEVADLARVIRRLSEAGATVLLVEHNFPLICEVSDEVYVLESGRLIASGTPEEVQHDEAVIRSYLGQSAETRREERRTDAAAEAGTEPAGAAGTAGATGTAETVTGSAAAAGTDGAAESVGRGGQWSVAGRRAEPVKGGRITVPGERVLEVSSLSAGYGDLRVLWDVSLSVLPGRATVVLGSNGAGKTTLLSTVAGLLKVSAGTVTFLGTDLTRVPAPARTALGIGFVQENKRVFKERTVEQNLQLGCHTMPRGEVRGAIESAYERFPVLGQKRKDLAGALSGGQQQMLAIAQALMPGPKLLMLDEPSAGLAPVIVQEVLETVSDLKASGLGILLVEQLVDQALSVADDVVVMEQGRTEAGAAVDGAAGLSALRDMYLGSRSPGPRTPVRKGADS